MRSGTGSHGCTRGASDETTTARRRADEPRAARGGVHMILEAMRRIRALERRCDELERENAELREGLERLLSAGQIAPQGAAPSTSKGKRKARAVG